MGKGGIIENEQAKKDARKAILDIINRRGVETFKKFCLKADTQTEEHELYTQIKETFGVMLLVEKIVGIEIWKQMYSYPLVFANDVSKQEYTTQFLAATHRALQEAHNLIIERQGKTEDKNEYVLPYLKGINDDLVQLSEKCFEHIHL